jgi:hypothetical protein
MEQYLAKTTYSLAFKYYTNVKVIATEKTLQLQIMIWGARYLTGDNLKVVWALFSTLS